MRPVKALGIAVALGMLAAAGSAQGFQSGLAGLAEVQRLPCPCSGRQDSARGRSADDPGGIDGHRRPDEPAARHASREGRHGHPAEGTLRHPDPHAEKVGTRVLPEPLAQLPANGSSCRQRRGTAVRDLRAVPHRGQDLFVPDDRRELGEAQGFPLDPT